VPHDHDRDRVRDHVVELSRDPSALFDDRGLGLSLLLLETMLAFTPQPDRETREPGAADDQRGKRDISNVERIAVVGDEPHDEDRDQQRPCDPRLAPARVRAQRVQPEHDHDAEERRALVEIGGNELEDREPHPDCSECGEGKAAAKGQRERCNGRSDGHDRPVLDVRRHPELDLQPEEEPEREHHVGTLPDNAPDVNRATVRHRCRRCRRSR
jgi:hypothetical protein